MLGFIFALLTVFHGVVLDEQHEPIPYATVYPEEKPELGTATNNAGRFIFEADLQKGTMIIVSCIGFEKLRIPQKQLTAKGRIPEIILKEQPIALEETVVAAKASKQKNKRKKMAMLLHDVYTQIEKDFPDENAFYQIVSDVKMNSDGNTWGMEQMIADIVVMPEKGHKGLDSVQFHGRYCKRFFDAEKRAQADAILAGDGLERMESKGQNKKSNGAPAHFMRRAANAVDSGVVVHKALFAWGNMRYDFEIAMNDLRHWKVSNESEGETVLTHTETVSKYLGLFKMNVQRHYIVDSKTYSVRRFSEHADVKVNIPFGIKLDQDQLQMLNLLNMDEKQYEKFRLRKFRGAVDYNTLYQRRNEMVYTQEKNMLINAFIIGTKKAEIPLVIQATQRVTNLQTEDVQPFSKDKITLRVKREIVPIY